jgi:GGDEF domain-containing protein
MSQDDAFRCRDESDDRIPADNAGTTVAPRDKRPTGSREPEARDVFFDLPEGHLHESRLLGRIAAATRRHDPIAVVFVDLGGLPAGIGLDAGKLSDTLHMIAATRIAACLDPSDLLCPLEAGGFALLLADVRDSNRVVELACRIRHRIAEVLELGDRRFRLEVQFSRSFRPLDVAHFERVARRHDEARIHARLASLPRMGLH